MIHSTFKGHLFALLSVPANHSPTFFRLPSRMKPGLRPQKFQKTVFPFLLLALLFFMAGKLQAQPRLWGMTNLGGTENAGAIISMNRDGSDFNAISFPKISGESPLYGNLLEASNGKMYGMTSLGGYFTKGVIIEYDPGTNTYLAIHYFNSSPDANTPYGSLIESGGKFYGMTSKGGSNDRGTLFEFNPTGNVFTVLKHFSITADGGTPYGSLIESGGKFYGLTSSGGSNSGGTLFEFNPTGNVFTVLKNFNSFLDGTNPYGSLIESGGKFYGLTRNGGSNNYGTLFELNPTGNVFTVLNHFGLATDGRNPYGSLIESGGKFYGMTANGGSIGYGTLFEWNPMDNVYTVLKNFNPNFDGGYPHGSLVESGGKFYGLTATSGSLGADTLFEFNPAGNVFTVLKHFNSSPDGANPKAVLSNRAANFTE